ncbi:MAG: MFS transporter [Thermoplasmata archaeon]|nr:MFS transporter [Thermoplasmata archaeon]
MSSAISRGSVSARGAFVLLAVSNLFVGLVVGTERTLVPLLGVQVFGLASAVAALSFIATFGVTKALANLVSGAFTGTRRTQILIAGWLVGLPVPLLIMFAPSTAWWIVLFANVLLGVNQGLCWSSTVMLMIDQMPPARRGFAAGVNEFAGYGGVGLAAFVTGWLAAAYGIRQIPFLLGFVADIFGLLLALWLARNLVAVAALKVETSFSLRVDRSLKRFTFRERALLPFHQAGLATNLKDGIAWGLFPLLFATHGVSLPEIGVLVAAYPATWGLVQLGTGPLSDKIGRGLPIVAGMALQAAALFGVALGSGFNEWLFAMVVLGLGTALVYPTLQAAVADAVRSRDRDEALATYRFWRDMGFVVGALGGGILADRLGLPETILATAVIAMSAGVVVGTAARGFFRPARGAAFPSLSDEPTTAEGGAK